MDKKEKWGFVVNGNHNDLHIEGACVGEQITETDLTNMAEDICTVLNRYETGPAGPDFNVILIGIDRKSEGTIELVLGDEKSKSQIPVVLNIRPVHTKSGLTFPKIGRDNEIVMGNIGGAGWWIEIGYSGVGVHIITWYE